MIGKPGTTPLHWIGNAVRQNSFFNKRLSTLHAAMASHVEHEPDHHKDVAFLRKHPLGVDGLGIDKMLLLKALADGLLKRRILFRAHFADSAVLIMKDKVDSLLPSVDEAEQGSTLLSNDQLHVFQKVLTSMTKLCPDLVRHAAHSTKLNKLSSIMGAANIKNDIVSKTRTSLATPTDDSIMALTRSMEVATGVDMAEHSEAIHKLFNNFFVSGGFGLLKPLEPTVLNDLLERLEEIGKAAQLNDWEGVFFTAGSQILARTLIKN